MDYQIKTGDCLWSIAQSNYNCKTEKEIQDTVKQIATANNIKDPNTIQANANLVLPASATAKFKEQNKGDSFVSSQASNTSEVDEFDQWSVTPFLNGIKNFFSKGKGDFKMFNYNKDSYAEDLKGFSQKWIDKYDADKDGNWNYNEFVSMATNGEYTVDELDEETNKIYTEQFNTFSFDDNADSINAEEAASVLYTHDLDYEKLNAANGDVWQAVDGQINNKNYYTHPQYEVGSDTYNALQEHRSSFYETFYAE